MFYSTGVFSDIIYNLRNKCLVIVMEFLGLMALFMFAFVVVSVLGAICIAVMKLIFKLLVKIFQLIFR